MSTMSGEAEEKPPWRQREVLKELWNEEDLTNDEMGERLGCSGPTVSHWLRRLGVKDGFPDVEIEDMPEKPWQDEDLMYRLYHEEELSAGEIAMVLDCSTGGVSEWIGKHDFEKRTQKEASQLALGQDHVTFRTSKKGYEAWWYPGSTFYVHRLLAVAEFGFEEARDKHVHHKNGVHWDNRPENLELATNSEHQRKHLKVPEPDREEIADMYEETDKSSYQIADEVEHDISASTVRVIHEEYYNNES